MFWRLGDAGLLVQCPESIASLLAMFLHGWSIASADSGGRPAVRAVSRGDGWRIEAHSLPRGGVDLTGDLAAAELVADAAACELVASRERTILPHAAAVEIGHGAALLLGDSGSGKSTLALTLAAMGCRLIADDRVGLAVEDGAVMAMALGLAPKARLPLPAAAAAGLPEFVKARSVRAGNGVAVLKLATDEQAPPGVQAPVRAFIRLDRRGGAARLEAESRAVIVRTLAEAAAAPGLTPEEVLAIAVAATAAVPTYRLGYGESDEAARLLVEDLGSPSRREETCAIGGARM